MMFGRIVGEGGRGLGVDRDEQASGKEKKIDTIDKALIDIEISLNSVGTKTVRCIIPSSVVSLLLSKAPHLPSFIAFAI